MSARNYFQESPRTVATQNSSRSESSPRNYGNIRSQESPRSSSPRDFSQQRGNSQRSDGNSRGYSEVRLNKLV